MTELSCYSPLKVFHHQDRLELLRAGGHPSPVHVQLVPTNRCNQACLGCAYRTQVYTSTVQFYHSDEMPWIKLQQVVCECTEMGVHAVHLTGRGQLTVHPQFQDLCAAIIRRDMSLAVVTNGSVWSDAHADLLCKARWVRFSIDAASPEVYSFYRRVPPKTYLAVREHIRNLAGRTNRECVVGVGFVVTEHNWQEIAQACRHAREDGADNFRVSALFQSRALFRG